MKQVKRPITDEAVDAAARVIFAADGHGDGGAWLAPWEEVSEETRTTYRLIARIALHAAARA